MILLFIAASEDEVPSDRDRSASYFVKLVKYFAVLKKLHMLCYRPIAF